jgi:gas vesicle protein
MLDVAPDPTYAPANATRRPRNASEKMQQPETSPSAAIGQGGVAMAPSDLEALVASVHSSVDRWLEDALHGIQQTATALMREIASEVWRTAGGDKDEIRETILDELSHDEAIRSVLALADERFQALAARTARLEDTVNGVADSVRATNERLADGVALLAKMGAGGGTSGDASALREQLAAVTREVSDALSMLAERDQAIVETVQSRIRDHGELITQETARISGAMQSYVQHGVEAIGQLAGTMEAQLASITDRDRELEARVLDAFAEQMRSLAEQLALMYERMAIDTTTLAESITHTAERTEERTRAVGEYLHLLNDRIALAQRETSGEVSRVVDARVMGLAKMVRSDAETLRAELVRVAAGQDENLARTLDERLAHVSDAVSATTTTIVDDLAGRMREEMAEAVRDRIDEAVSRLEARSDDLATRLEARSDEVVARFEARANEQATLVEGRIDETVGALDQRLDLVRISVDDRIASLARLVRSDNETLAQQIVADQESSKQALRAMKELQASLPTEVIDMVEQRFASLAESIERSNEMLAKRIDRMADTIGERHDNDIQIVIDRMGDAMHALANFGRPAAATAGAPGARAAVADPRIDLE